jgi:hypothetical protein
MRFAAALAFVSLAALAAPAFGQSFVGDWAATAATPGGTVSETLKVVKMGDGYSIAAKLVVPNPAGAPEAGPGTDIVIDGDKFSYKRTVSGPGGDLVITYSGVVSGDTFTGLAEIGGFGHAPYNGVRIKAGR